MTELAAWVNFYVIVGSSAGALIGLQFVVITLFTNMPIGENTAEGSSAYATPTVIHFGAVLLLSAVLCSLARDRRRRNSLGPGGRRWDLLRDHRGAPYA